MTLDDPQLDAILQTYAVPAPGDDLTVRVLAAAAPLLAAYAARPDWARVGRAVLVAVTALPTAVAFDAILLQGVYRALALVLPDALSLALTVQYGLGLLMMFGAAFVFIPVVAGHVPALVEEPHV